MGLLLLCWGQVRRRGDTPAGPLSRGGASLPYGEGSYSRSGGNPAVKRAEIQNRTLPVRMTQFPFAVMELGVCVVQTWRAVTHVEVAVAHTGMAVTQLPMASG